MHQVEALTSPRRQGFHWLSSSPSSSSSFSTMCVPVLPSLPDQGPCSPSSPAQVIGVPSLYARLTFVSPRFPPSSNTSKIVSYKIVSSATGLFFFVCFCLFEVVLICQVMERSHDMGLITVLFKYKNSYQSIHLSFH